MRISDWSSDVCSSDLLHASESLAELERAYDDWKAGRWSAEPYFDMLIPTAIDPTMAPPGKHMMTVFVQYAPYELASGEPWDGPAREALAETVIAKIARHSPDFRDLILRSEEHTSELQSLMR